MIDINLNELTLDNIETWPKPIKITVAAVVGLLILGLGSWLIIKPKYDTYQHLEKTEKQLRLDFEKKQHQAANLQQYKVQLVELKRRFSKMLQQLPSKNEMDKLLEDISKTGIASGLKFTLFDPANEIEHDFYVELPINIKVEGNYHQLAVFLSRVAAMSRIVTLHDFAINVKENKKKPGGDDLVMHMTAKIYRYRTFY